MQKERVFKVNEVVGFAPSGAEDTFISRMLIDEESVGAKRISLNHLPLGPERTLAEANIPAPMRKYTIYCEDRVH